MMIRNISANDYDVKDNENAITQTMSRWKILLRTNEDMKIAKEVHTQNTERSIYLPGVFYVKGKSKISLHIGGSMYEWNTYYDGVKVWLKHF